jgi:hypothetical protein
MLARRLGRWFEALETRKQSHGDSRCPGFCLREPLVGLAEPWVDGGRSRFRAFAPPPPRSTGEVSRPRPSALFRFVLRRSRRSRPDPAPGDRRPPSALLCLAQALSGLSRLFVSSLSPLRRILVVTPVADSHRRPQARPLPAVPFSSLPLPSTAWGWSRVSLKTVRTHRSRQSAARNPRPAGELARSAPLSSTRRVKAFSSAERAIRVVEIPARSNLGEHCPSAGGAQGGSARSG